MRAEPQGADPRAAAVNPYEITERDYGHKVIKRVLEVRVGAQLIAGAWKQPMSSGWSINIVKDVVEPLGLPRDYLDFSIDVRDENEARRILQFLGLLYTPA